MAITFYYKSEKYETNIKYQRNAWLTVSLAIIGIGGSILAPNIYEYIIGNLLDFSDMEYSPLYGFICILLGIAVLAISQTVVRKRNEKLQDENKKSIHDTTIGESISEEIKERELFDVLSNLKDDHSIWRDHTNYLMSLDSFLESSDNKFLFSEIESTKESLKFKIRALCGFLAVNFFVFPSSQDTSKNYRSCMKPNWNQDRTNNLPISPQNYAAYDELTNELNALCDEIESEFKALKLELKQSLGLTS